VADPKLTKDDFFRLQTKKGVPDASARREFRRRFGYYPELVGREVDLYSLEGSRRLMPRTKRGKIPVGFGVGGVEGPAPPPETLVELPAPARDEEELRERLRQMRDQDVEVHPRHVGRGVPHARHLGGRPQRDVLGFTRLVPLHADELGQRTPRFQITWDDLDPVTPDESGRPPRELTRVDMPATMARRAAPQRRSLHPYVPRIDLEPEDQMRFPGVLRDVATLMNRQRVRADPDLQLLRTPEAKAAAARKMEDQSRPRIDIRHSRRGEVDRTKTALWKAKKQVAKHIRKRTRGIAARYAFPPGEADAVADAVTQEELERDDQTIASLLWVALQRAHKLSTDGFDHADLLDRPLAHVRGLAPVEFPVPYDTEQAPGNKQELNEDLVARYGGPDIENKKLGDWLQFLWTNLSPLARERLAKLPALQHYGGVKGLSEAFRKNPFILHPLDIIRMYKDHTRYPRNPKGSWEAGEDADWMKRWGPEYLRGFKPWAHLGRRGKKHGIGTIGARVQEEVFRKYYEKDRNFFGNIARSVAAAAGTALGIVEGAAEIAAPLLSPLPTLGRPRGEVDPDTLSGRELRPLTGEEKDDIRTLFIGNNIRKRGYNYLTPRQERIVRGMQTYDHSRMRRIHIDIEKHIAKQIDKDVFQAADEEIDALYEMIPHMVMTALGLDTLSPEEIENIESHDWWGYLGAYFARGEEFGKDLSTSVVVGLMSLLTNPVDNLRAFPVTSTLTLLPLLRGLRAGSRWAGLPDKVRGTVTRMIELGTRIKAATAELMAKVPTPAGLRRLKDLAVIRRGTGVIRVIPEKTIQMYERMLSGTDYMRNAAERLWADYKTKFVDKAAQAEAAAGRMLDYVFRGSQEKYFSQYRAEMLKWTRLLRDKGTGRLTEAFKLLDPRGQRIILASIHDALKARGLKAGTPEFRSAMKSMLAQDFATHMGANAVGRRFLDYTRKGGPSGIHTQAQPVAALRKIVEDAAEMAINGEAGVALRGRRVTDVAGTEMKVAGLDVLHMNPRLVIALLEDMLANPGKGIWGASGLSADATVRMLKARGAFGRVVNDNVRRHLGMPKGETLRWSPPGGEAIFSDPNFRTSILATIERLRTYIPLPNRARGAMGLPPAQFADDGSYALKPGAKGAIADPLDSGGTWVPRAMVEFIEDGARRLPWEGKVAPTIGSGPAELMGLRPGSYTAHPDRPGLVRDPDPRARPRLAYDSDDYVLNLSAPLDKKMWAELVDQFSYLDDGFRGRFRRRTESGAYEGVPQWREGVEVPAAGGYPANTNGAMYAHVMKAARRFQKKSLDLGVRREDMGLAVDGVIDHVSGHASSAGPYRVIDDYGSRRLLAERVDLDLPGAEFHGMYGGAELPAGTPPRAGGAFGAEEAAHTLAALQMRAHRLGITGVQKMDKTALATAIAEAIPRQADVKVAARDVMTPGAAEMALELKAASLEAYKAGGSLAPLPATVADAAGLMAEWKRLLKFAEEAPEAFAVGMEHGIGVRARRVAEQKQRTDIRDAMVSEGSQAVGLITEAVREGRIMDSTPSVIILGETITPEAGRHLMGPRRLIGGRVGPTPKGSLESVIAKEASDAVERIAADSTLTEAQKATKIRKIKRSAANTSMRLQNYVDLGLSKKGEYNVPMRQYYGLDASSPIYVPKKFAKQLEFNFNVRQDMATQPFGRVVEAITQFARRGQTIYNPVALINNTSANYMLQAMARGVDPLTLTTNMRDMWSMWRTFEVDDGAIPKPAKFKDWKKGRPEAEVEKAREMFEAFKAVGIDLGASGRGLANIVSGEYLAGEGALTRMARAAGEKVVKGGGEAAASVVRTLGAPFRKHKELYAFSDDIFRAEDAAHSYRYVHERLAKLEKGRFFRMRTGHNRYVRITRDGGEWFVNGKAVDKGSINLEVARAAKFAANQKFVNYSDIANWPERVRSTGFVNLLTPHYTWRFHAMPMPGRRGIVGRLFTEQVEYWTDSPAISGVDAGANATKMARMVALNGLHRQQFDPNRETWRTAHSYDPLSVGNTSRFQFGSNPLFVGVDAMRSMSTFDPAVRLAHVVWNVLSPSKPKEIGRLALAQYDGNLRAYGFSADRYEELTGQEKTDLAKRFTRLRKALRRSSNARVWQDVAELSALGGSTLASILTQLTFRKRKDLRQLDMERMLTKDIFPILLTHMGAKMVDTVASQVAPESALTRYRGNRWISPESQMRGIKYYINLWMGIGAPNRPIRGDMESAKNILKKAWRDSMIPKRVLDAYWRRERILSNPLSTDEQKAEAHLAIRWVDAVKGAVDSAIDEWADNYWRARRQYDDIRMGRKGVTRAGRGFGFNRQGEARLGSDELEAERVKLQVRRRAARLRALRRVEQQR
jgi:hypothetical protein